MSDIIDDLFGDADAEELTVKEKCAKDLELFCKTFFPDTFTSEFCDFHKDVFRNCENYILNEDYKGLKKYMARAAPRGHGKSQIISFGLPIWCICYGYKKNILIVSDTADQAVQFINDIKNELEDNDSLIRDFGQLVGRKIWTATRIVTANNVHCIGKGAAQKLRGIKYNSNRPDLIIIDDLENDENVETEGQRRKLFNWFMKALLKCGSTDTLFVYIGTILSYESLLHKVLHDKRFAMWDRKIYRAIYNFSESELWVTWEDMITRVDFANSEEEGERIAEESYRFYKANREKMLKDVVCLWPQKEEDYYYNLMVEKVMDEESFNSEEQNDPMTEENRDFKESWLEENTYTELPEIKEIYGAIDPSLGKNRNSDTSAIVLLGRGVDHFIYVLVADICKRRPDVLIEDMTKYILQYHDKLKGFVLETNVMQEYFATNIKEKFHNLEIDVNWIEVLHKSGDSKDRRIKSMIPKFKHGRIKVSKKHVTLWNQLKNYPKGHDDGVDCLQMALEPMVSVKDIQFGWASISVGRQRQSFGRRW